jgi:hypothetical protein
MRKISTTAAADESMPAMLGLNNKPIYLRCALYPSYHPNGIYTATDARTLRNDIAFAREAGFDMRVTLEAVVGFVNRSNGSAVTRITTPSRLLPARRGFDLTTNDRRFLRSLRIGCDEGPSKETVDNN